ncbi:MAG: hypothetical protein KAI86_13815 [Desulfobacterales bacterium]|nr:hypothetical protein [Desulfobacterales bacterium]
MKSIGLIVIATIAVGLFAMPATMAYFTGQHQFVDAVSVDCTKCHGDIETELTGGLVHEFLDCQACHVTTDMSVMGDNPNLAKAGHASVAVECMDCHDSAVGGFPQAGALGDHDITNDTAAHNDWYLAALNSDINYGANEVCIACHTHTNVEITWTAADANMTYDQSTGVFGEVSNV